MIILFFIFLLFSLFLALKRPSYFTVFYILASSKFLGFVDIESLFVFGGTGLGGPSLNAVTLVAALSSKNRFVIPKSYFYFIAIFLVFFVYGITLPTLLGLEGVSQAVIAGKEFWVISILIYFVIYRNRINTKMLLDTVKFIGLYLSWAYFVHKIVGLSPPYYLSDETFRGFFPTYISLALFIYYSDWQCRVISSNRFLLISTILIVGLVLAGHMALVLGTIASLIVLYLVFSGNKIDVTKLVVQSIGMLGVVIVVFISSSTIREGVYSQVELIVSGDDTALASRDIYNKFRWEAIEERPFGGYGFIHKSAPITKQYQSIRENRFAESFGVIDSGYVDLLIRFGYVGTLLYLMLWAGCLIKVLKNIKDYEFVQLVMVFYLLQYFVINVTWSVFSFSHGLIPAFIAVYITLARFKRSG
ncbi:MAG: O-antigen ligase family protein [Pseudomonadales bacterium]|nr:O-antigen ligase family protein [Pseudomonadales bacterium]